MKLETARGFNGECRDGVNALFLSLVVSGNRNRQSPSSDLMLAHPLGGSVCLRKLSKNTTGKKTGFDDEEEEEEEEDETKTIFFCDESDVRDQTQITCATTSPCGKFIASGSRVNVSTNVAHVRVWPVGTVDEADERRRQRGLREKTKKQSEEEGEKKKSAAALKLSLHKGEVIALAFSPCSKFLASLGGASDNYQLVLWRLEDGKAMCGRNTFGATTTAFLHRTSGNPSLVTAGADESGVVVWEFDSAKRSFSSEKCRLGQIRRDAVKVAVSENDEFAYLGTKTGDVLKVSLTGDRLFKKKSDYKASGGVTSLALVKSTGRDLLLVGGGDGSVNVLDAETMDEHHLKGSKGNGKVFANGKITSIVVLKSEEESEDEERSDDTTVETFVPVEQVNKQYHRRSPATIVKVPPSNATIKRRQRAARENADAIVTTHTVLVGTSKCDIELFHLTRDDNDIMYGTGEITPKAEKPLSLVSPAAIKNKSDNGKVLICGGHDAPVNDIAFPRNCEGLFATCAGTEIRLWRTEDCEELSRITASGVSSTCENVVFAPDGFSIISAWSDGNIRFHSPKSGTLLATMEDCHPAGVSALEISRDGLTLISGGVDGAVRVWTLPEGGYATAALKASMKEHRAKINSVVFSNDESIAASASDDGACILWNMKKNSRYRMLKCFNNAFVKSALFHPADDSILVTASSDRKIIFWDVQTGEPTREFEANETSEVTSLSLHALDASKGGSKNLLLAVSGGSADPVVKLFRDESEKEPEKEQKEENQNQQKVSLLAIGRAHSTRINRLKFSRDGERIVSCGQEGGVFVWRI
jgi:WD40 repeat protein